MDSENSMAFSEIAQLIEKVASNSLDGEDSFRIIHEDIEELIKSTVKPSEFTFGLDTLEKKCIGIK